MAAAFFVLQPEVAGGLGENTIMDRSVHPPRIERLHYVFDGWLGDQLVESFPSFLVTASLGRHFADLGLTGAEFAGAEISVSVQFAESTPDVSLPDFVWLRPLGVAGRDDFGTSADGRLVVSARAMDLIRSTRPTALDVTRFIG